MLDPLIFKLIAMVFALLLITAGVHKLDDRLRFQGILTAYQILPAILVVPASVIIPLSEIMIGLAWILAWRIDLVSVVTVALLTAYAMAMGINLMRGRTYIDCGCGFSSAKAKGDHSGIQQLSVWLVYRNLVLIALAFVAGAGITERGIGVLDYFSLTAATLALVFIYDAFNQLLMNNNAINSWRKPLLTDAGTEAQHD